VADNSIEYRVCIGMFQSVSKMHLIM